MADQPSRAERLEQRFPGKYLSLTRPVLARSLLTTTAVLGRKQQRAWAQNLGPRLPRSDSLGHDARELRGDRLRGRAVARRGWRPTSLASSKDSRLWPRPDGQCDRARGRG